MPYCSKLNFQNTEKTLLIFSISRLKSECASQKSFSVYFIGVHIINRILHDRLWIRIVSSCVQLDISHSFAAFTREISS